MTLKRFVRLDKRRVELRPDSHNPEHQPIKIDLAKHILHIDGVAVGALIGGSAARANKVGPARKRGTDPEASIREHAGEHEDCPTNARLDLIDRSIDCGETTYTSPTSCNAATPVPVARSTGPCSD